VGDVSLVGADELGELDLGEASSHASVHQALTEGRARESFSGHLPRR
jgi:hypothetical protein